jgi:hypothetical protein
VVSRATRAQPAAHTAAFVEPADRSGMAPAPLPAD